MAPRRAAPELLIGLGVLAFAGFVLAQTWAIPVSPLYAQVGPTLFPAIIAGGLGVLGVFLVLAALRGGWQSEEERAVAIDWPAVAWVAAGLLANLALIQWLGFTVAATLMLVLVARGFGSRALLRDVAIGFALSLGTYFGFAKALGIDIGAGAFERLLGA